MFTVQVSTLVQAPLAEAFAYVADFRNAPVWQRQLVEVRMDDGPFPDGKRVVEVRNFMGRRIEAPGELVAWNPMNDFTVRGHSGPMHVESRYGFNPEPSGTRIRLRLTMSAQGPARLGEPVLKRTLEHELTIAFRRLAAVLDGDFATG